MALAVESSQDASSKSKSSHTSDPFLAPFLEPDFDPVAYLNATLPPLQTTNASTSSSRAGAKAGGRQPVPLAELSSQAQDLTSQLNAHTTRLSTILTQLTDDILRSGSRLAYEVELLRGETISLAEAMHEDLKDDIQVFVAGGLQPTTAKKGAATTPGLQGVPTTTTPDGPISETELLKDEPSYVQKLHTLTVVRSQLEEVIKTFGDAMDFVFPPSEVSVSSSFLSVSAPEPGSSEQSLEEKGQQVLQKLRNEISDLLNDPEDDIRGVEKAAQRVEEIKELTTVWKGTAEERGRTKFVESLAKMVEDRHRELLKKMELAARKPAEVERPGKNNSNVTTTTTTGAATGGGETAATETKSYTGYGGLISQLQRIRGGL